MAPATLRAIVVGGGIAGMATALSLREAGYSVTILEKQEKVNTRPGGIRCPPNMTRLLDRWLDKLMLVDISRLPKSLARLLDQRGDKPQLKNCYYKCDSFKIERGDSGRHIGYIPIDDEFVNDMGAQFHYIPRADLLDLFLALAIHETVDILCNAEVSNLNTSLDEIEVHLTNGSKMTADLVVGADGYSSTIRSLASLDKPCEEVEEKHLATVYFTVPRHIMAADEELRVLVDHPTEWPIWFAKGYSMSGNVMGLHGDFGVFLTYQADGSKCLNIPLGKSTALKWVENLDIGDLGSVPTKLIMNAEDASIEITLLPRPALCTMSTVSDNGRIVLVGHAAHSLAFGELSTSLAIEEAVILGDVQKHARDTTDIPTLLGIHEEITQNHCTIEEQGDWMVSKHHADEREMIWGVWMDFIDLMRYDAQEAVESWRRDWGSGSILESGLIQVPIVVNVTIGQLSNPTQTYGYRGYRPYAHANSS